MGKKTGHRIQSRVGYVQTGGNPSRKLPAGTIIIPEEETVGKPDYVICYARVSSSQNKKNLDSRMERLNAFCAASGYIVKKSVKECASGLNDKRPGLCKILFIRESHKNYCRA